MNYYNSYIKYKLFLSINMPVFSIDDYKIARKLPLMNQFYSMILQSKNLRRIMKFNGSYIEINRHLRPRILAEWASVQSYQKIQSYTQYSKVIKNVFLISLL